MRDSSVTIPEISVRSGASSPCARRGRENEGLLSEPNGSDARTPRLIKRDARRGPRAGRGFSDAASRERAWKRVSAYIRCERVNGQVADVGDARRDIVNPLEDRRLAPTASLRIARFARGAAYLKAAYLKVADIRRDIAQKPRDGNSIRRVIGPTLGSVAVPGRARYKLEMR